MKFVASVMCSLESSLLCRADAACRRYYISLHNKKKQTLPGIYSEVCVWAATAGRDCGEVINIVYIDVAVVVIGDCGRSWCRCESSSVPKNHDGLRALWIKVSSLRVLQNMQMFVLCSLSSILLWHFAAIFVAADSANPAAGGCIRCDFVAYLRAAEPACCRRFAGIKLGAWVKLLTSETFPLCRHWLCIQTKTDVEIPSSVLDMQKCLGFYFVFSCFVWWPQISVFPLRPATHADVSLRNIVVTFYFCGNVRNEKVISELPSVMSGLHARFCYSYALISFLLTTFVSDPADFLEKIPLHNIDVCSRIFHDINYNWMFGSKVQRSQYNSSVVLSWWGL